MRETRFAVRFDEYAWQEDLSHATPAGKRAAQQARERLEREGVRYDQLQRCLAEGRDATRLAGCVKLYVPDSSGPWRIVFRGDLSQPRPALFAFAFGEGHPRDVWHPSVYQVADRRLHGPAEES